MRVCLCSWRGFRPLLVIIGIRHAIPPVEAYEITRNHVRWYKVRRLPTRLPWTFPMTQDLSCFIWQYAVVRDASYEAPVPWQLGLMQRLFCLIGIKTRFIPSLWNIFLITLPITIVIRSMISASRSVSDPSMRWRLKTRFDAEFCGPLRQSGESLLFLGFASGHLCPHLLLRLPLLLCGWLGREISKFTLKNLACKISGERGLKEEH